MGTLRWLLGLFPCLLMLPTVSCLIPRACVSNLTASPVVCCPTPPGHRHPCGFPALGQCARVQIYRQILRKDQLFFEKRDVRFRWPERIFQYTCQCNARHWGPDCSECWFGYEGRRCERRVVRKRRNIASYSSAERRQLVQVFMKTRQVKCNYVIPRMKTDSHRLTGKVIEADPYELLTYVHFLGAIPIISKYKTMCFYSELAGWDSGHQDSGFPIYHRYLMMMFEREMRKVARRFFGLHDFTLPYWDWTNSRQCDICTDDLIGRGTGAYNSMLKCNNVSSASPFGTDQWKVYCQDEKNEKEFCRPCYLEKAGRLCRRWLSFDLPTVQAVEQALRITKFQNRKKPCNSFAYVLERGSECFCKWDHFASSLHSNIHGRSSGTMGPLASSIYDPLFIFHHVQVDRLVERWLRAIQPSSTEFSNVNRMVPMCRDCYIGSFFPLVKYRELFRDSRALGYSYDSLDFGSLSEKTKVGHWNNTYVPKKCPKAPL